MVPTEFCTGCFCAIRAVRQAETDFPISFIGQSVKNWASGHSVLPLTGNLVTSSVSRATSAQILGLIAISGFLKSSGALRRRLSFNLGVDRQEAE